MEIIKVGFLLFMIILQAHEFTGYSISQFPEISTIHHLSEESAPNITKKIGILSPLPLPRGSAIPPAVVSQPHTSAPMSQPFKGFLPSMAPCPPAVVPSLNSAPLPQVIQGVAPFMPPSSPIVIPTAEPEPAPEPLQGLVPSVPPISPDGSTDYTAPVKQFVQGIEPSTPPSVPVVVPPDKSEPIPQPLQGIVPFLPPIPPVDVLSRNSAPSPIFIQGNVPSTPPSPQVVVPSNKSELVPQPLEELVPSTPPRPPVFVPSEKSAPMSQVVQGIVPSMPPDPPTILPPNKSSPLPQVVPGIVPSLPPNYPVTEASNKSALMPLVVPEVPPVSPVPPISVPSNKSAPPPQVVTGIVPSMPPNPPVAVPSNTSAPLPRVAPIDVQSMPPLPPISVPSNTSAPPLQVVTWIVPSIPPNLPGTMPSNKSAPPPQAIPGIVPSMPPNPPTTVPSNKSAPPPRVAPIIVPSVPLTPTISVPSDKSPPLPQVVPGVVPSMPPSSPIAIPSNRSAQTPQVVQGIVPSISPSLPIVVPSHKVAPMWQVLKGIAPFRPPSVPSHGIPPESGIPTKMPLAPAPIESPPNVFPQKPSAMHPIMPRIAPSVVPPVKSPPGEYTRNPPAAHPTLPKIDPSMESEPASPLSILPSSIKNKTRGIPVTSPPLPNHFPPIKHPSTKASPPRKSMRPSDNAPAPSKLSLRPVKSSQVLSPASPPTHSYRKYHHSRRSARTPAPSPSSLFPPPTSNHQGPATAPPTSPSPIAPPKKRTRRHRHYPPPTNHAPFISPGEPPFPSTIRHHSPVPSPLSPARFGPSPRPSLPPSSSPSGSLSRKPRAPLPPLIQALPPPPPNQDCMALACTEPLTNSPPGSPCGCVAPMQVGLRLGVALYAFFPLVSELAEEIATGVFMKLSQVRVKGANADGQQLDETVVLIDLVPLGERFDNTTAFLTFEKFWCKQVPIKATLFGDYEVLYVRYPGLPPSPPSALDDGSVHGRHGRVIHPFGVDVRKKRGRIGGTLIAIILLSSSIAIALGFIVIWLLILRCGNHSRQIPATAPPLLMPSLSKPSAGTAGSMVFGSGPSSASMSFASSINTYAGSVKTYSAGEIEKATNNFHDTRILGEGGFGRVYRGILDDGTNVAVKVLKRDDQQGGREFLAEIEMLGRLHHRNLVKLIGICVEEKARCLVYELISNGSVESHLHGPDKDTAPLDWCSRIKIALGAARGLAYLHEDSSPHVIHRDFKSSNILLEHDFTPKVSDFGLARTALEEGDQHITTRVMGTFGYVAPEYAMTGHLLVKSDVYSYGVVLLELLTGRKPVDMLQPQGQENLVSWARPFLTSKEGLEMIIDPSLGSNVPFDSVGKVAAIASMCVQPEVTHRPFMGEVVQALKLVYYECDESKAGGSESCGQEDSSVADMETRTSSDSSQLPDSSSRARYSVPDYSTSPEAHSGLSLSASDVFSSSRVGRQESGSFRRCSSSGPLRTGRSRQFWERVRGLSRGTVSEHGVAFRL